MMKYVTIICVNAWQYDRTGELSGDPSGKSQSYADPDTDPVDGWSVYTCHRDPRTDDLIDPEEAFDFDEDFNTKGEADRAALALQKQHGWEVREY